MLLNLGYFMRPYNGGTITSAPGAPTWQPTDLSGLIGWWDASDASTVLQTTTTGRVQQWNDKSGNDNHLSQGTPANEPVTGTTTINSLNTIEFGNGAAHYLSPDGDLTGNIAAIDAQDISIHAVFKQTNANITGALLCLKSTNGADSIMPAFAAGDKYYGPTPDGGSYLIIDPSPFSEESAAVLGFESNATDMVLYKNGTLEDSAGTAAASDFFDRFIIGYRASSNKLWEGEIAEIIVSTALNTTDRQAVEGYLTNKWGL